MSFILAGVFILKAINMNFWKDWDVGILYLYTNFELDQSTNNGDLSSDKNHSKHRQTDAYTDWIWYTHHTGYRVELIGWNIQCHLEFKMFSSTVYAVIFAIYLTCFALLASIVFLRDTVCSFCRHLRGYNMYGPYPYHSAVIPISSWWLYIN